MVCILKLILKYSILFIFGAVIYYLIELLFRGYSHWTMALCGGICFVLIGLINEILPEKTPLWTQMLIGGGIITAVEFITGYIVNIQLGWNIWDYSDIPFNICGQICLPFTLLWIGISSFAVIADDYLRYWLFEEKMPHYTLK